MLKNLLIALIFLGVCFGGTYWFLLKFGFGQDPRKDFCPIRWEERYVEGNFQTGDILSENRLYYPSGKVETKDKGAFILARTVCSLKPIKVFQKD